MRFLSTIFYILISGACIAQTTTFNLLQDYGYPVNQFMDINVSEDTIVGLGIAYPDSFTLTQGVLLVKLDSNGIIVKSKLILDSFGRDLVVSEPNKKFVKTSDGGYALMAAPIQTDGAILYKLNRNLDVEFLVEYTDSNLISNFAYKIIETSNGYLLFGALQKPNYQIIGFLRSIDKTGNTLWYNEYNYGGVNNYVMDVKPINDSVFVACSNIDNDFSKYKGYSSIRTFDIHGNQLSYWESVVDDAIGHLVSILPTADGFIANGIRLVERQPNYYKVQSSFIKFDANYNVQWIKHWGRITRTLPSLRMYETRPTVDGNYVSIGKTAQDTNGDGFFYPVGWMFKFSPEGDSIWSRNITLPDPFQVNDNGMYAGGILTSGSIVAGGYGNIGWAYYGWIVKLTNDGCLDTLFSCAVSPVHDLPVNHNPLKIYPNPASDRATLLLPAMPESGILRVSDLLGRVRYCEDIASNSPQVDLALGQLMAGIYRVSVRFGSVVYSGRLVVGR